MNDDPNILIRINGRTFNAQEFAAMVEIPLGSIISEHAIRIARMFGIWCVVMKEDKNGLFTLLDEFPRS